MLFRLALYNSVSSIYLYTFLSFALTQWLLLFSFAVFSTVFIYSFPIFIFSIFMLIAIFSQFVVAGLYSALVLSTMWLYILASHILFSFFSFVLPRCIYLLWLLLLLPFHFISVCVCVCASCSLLLKLIFTFSLCECKTVSIRFFALSRTVACTPYRVTFNLFLMLLPHSRRVFGLHSFSFLSLSHTLANERFPFFSISLSISRCIST